MERRKETRGEKGRAPIRAVQCRQFEDAVEMPKRSVKLICTFHVQGQIKLSEPIDQLLMHQSAH